MISNSNYLENIYTCSFKKNGWVFFFFTLILRNIEGVKIYVKFFYVREEVRKFDKLT